jgi:hypothetical protein
MDENKFYKHLQEDTFKLNSALISSEIQYEQIGLYRGISSSILFTSVLCKINTRSVHDKRLVSLIKKSTHLLSSISYDVSFSSGLSGWAWTLNYVKKHNKIDPSTILNQIDKIIHLGFLRMLNEGNFDPVNGAIGVCNYYFQHKSNYQYISLLIDEMHKIEISNKCSFKPLSRKDKNNDDIIDIGLAHGIAGYSYFLKKAIHRNINKEKAQSLLKRCYKIFELVEQDYSINGSYFPYTAAYNNLKDEIDLKPQLSRLAWCYGDLGILYILYNNNYKKEKHLGMLLESTTRFDSNNTKITDQGFCHGSSGVAYIYWKLYLQTKNIRFLKAADFWIRQIILENKEKKILNDYKFLVGNFDQRGLQPYNHMLEGSIGLALVLNSYLHPEIEPTWDRCLLLS